MKILEDLKARGILEAVSHKEGLAREKVTFYAGIDPTSESLQIGNLFVLITMMRLQRAGHRPLIVMGGATGMIGDPSGKTQERPLLTEDILTANREKQKAQLQRYFDFQGDSRAKILNNLDWFHSLSFLEALRHCGKHFRLGEMMAKDSVKSRLKTENGMSYTEFSYQILQAYDFVHLCKHHQCQLQMGGADQWGNITAGIDLVRKMLGKKVFGFVIPLVTDPSGKKLGKTEEGALSLDPERTSPYQLYQFFFNTEDTQVGKFLRYYTFLSLEEIKELEHSLETQGHRREAQTRLAREVVALVHGHKGLERAENITRFFFGEAPENLTEEHVHDLQAILPKVTLPEPSSKREKPSPPFWPKPPSFLPKKTSKEVFSRGGCPSTINPSKTPRSPSRQASWPQKRPSS